MFLPLLRPELPKASSLPLSFSLCQPSLLRRFLCVHRVRTFKLYLWWCLRIITRFHVYCVGSYKQALSAEPANSSLSCEILLIPLSCDKAAKRACLLTVYMAHLQEHQWRHLKRATWSRFCWPRRFKRQGQSSSKSSRLNLMPLHRKRNKTKKIRWSPLHLCTIYQENRWAYNHRAAINHIQHVWGLFSNPLLPTRPVHPCGSAKSHHVRWLHQWRNRCIQYLKD